MIGCLDPDGLTGRARNESHFLEELPHLRRVRCDVGKKMWFNCVAAEVTRPKSAATCRIYGEGTSLFLGDFLQGNPKCSHDSSHPSAHALD